MTAPESAERLLRPVLEWMKSGGDAWQMNLDYWTRRRELMDEGEVFEGPSGEYLSNIDTAMDSYSPHADRGSHQIDERRLKSELETAVRGLRDIGFLG